MEQKEIRFPLFIDLNGRKAVVVGGGAIACRRAGVLKSFGAQVTLIAPEWKEHIEGVSWLQRPYQSGDLDGAVLAVAPSITRSGFAVGLSILFIATIILTFAALAWLMDSMVWDACVSSSIAAASFLSS